MDGETAAQHKATVLALREIASGEINEDSQKAQFDEFELFEDDADEETAPQE